jgi:hypothetical protein
MHHEHIMTVAFAAVFLALVTGFALMLSYFPAQNWAEELACTATAGRSKLHSSTMCRNSRDKAEYKPDSLSA